MARRNLAQDATLTLPGITRPVGRPRTGCAKTAAERMRAYRARRAAQAAEFPLPVTEIPDEWELPQPPAGYTADELERDNPFNQWMEDLSLQPSALRRGLLQQIDCYAMTRRFADPERFRNCGNLERNNCSQLLGLLGGFASAW